MSSNYFKSKLEITFKFYYLGFAGIIFGFVLLYHGIIYFALPLILSGIFLLLSPKGVMVDLTKRHVKEFYYFLFLKIGQWQNLDKYDLLVLGPNNSSKTIHGRYASHTVRNKSFSVYLLAEDKTKIELAEFTDYKKAKHYLIETSEILKVKAINKEELIKEIAAAKRNEREANEKLKRKPYSF